MSRNKRLTKKKKRIGPILPAGMKLFLVSIPAVEELVVASTEEEAKQLIVKMHAKDILRNAVYGLPAICGSKGREGAVLDPCKDYSEIPSEWKGCIPWNSPKSAGLYEVEVEDIFPYLAISKG